MASHISSLRRETAQKRIKAKIAVLAEYARKGIPEGTHVPGNVAEFRRWEDKSLGLEPIGSPNTLERPYNSHLKKRVLELIEELAKKQRRRLGRGQIINTQQIRVKSLARLVRELTSHLHSTRHDLEQAQQNEKRWKKRAEDLTEENGELLRKLATVTCLKPVVGNEG